jgi:hypothetical protein
VSLTSRGCVAETTNKQEDVESPTGWNARWWGIGDKEGGWEVSSGGFEDDAARVLCVWRKWAASGISHEERLCF